MQKTTIRAADIQPNDQFAGGQVSWIAVGTRTVTVHFTDGQQGYYDRDDRVTVLREDQR